MTLTDVLRRELVRMLARNLDNSPAASEIHYSVSVYEDDLRHRGLTDDDADRVKAAFDGLGPSITRFPTSHDILEAVPRRGANVLPGRHGNGMITDESREGMRKLVDIGRAALGMKPDSHEEKA